MDTPPIALPPEDRKRFAENLKRYRLATLVSGKELSQQTLGERAGLPQNVISKYERGRALPDLLSLLKLATGLRVSLESLVEGVNVRFDLMYQGLRATFTTTEDAATDGGAEPAADTMTIDEIVPGAPTNGAVHHEPPFTDVAEARTELRRLASDLLAVSARLAAGSVSVARDLGSGVRPRNARRRARARQKHAKKAPQKRR